MCEVNFFDRAVTGLIQVGHQYHWFLVLFDEAADDYPHPRQYLALDTPESFVQEVLRLDSYSRTEVWDAAGRLVSETARDILNAGYRQLNTHDFSRAEVVGWFNLPDNKPIEPVAAQP